MFCERLGLIVPYCWQDVDINRNSSTNACCIENNGNDCTVNDRIVPVGIETSERIRWSLVRYAWLSGCIIRRKSSGSLQFHSTL
ncbi:hypothetical protein EG68_05973 [Paragonimus skrjabini miyazakii]|uniref:Uncharacterized protein n=1 Tax=Paragonimus skrjabini miyazakii TaxID=59628 RepID=A0A8S9Z406_9TREM|nr:hypothetical protein EG68_05973 [Paragonimus skrjabini miyazakii]